jgi:outer membrane lipoprotein LolB
VNASLPSPGWRRSPVRLLSAALLAGVVSGCAIIPPQAAGEAAPQWSGRLGLQVRGDAPQSFSAGFLLRGSPSSGVLSLFTPIGSTAAVLRWSPGSARLEAEGQPAQQAESVDALLARATGAAVPVAALFDWLDGRPTAIAGWQPDLSFLNQGRLRATRTHPAPAVELRVVLEQP